MSTDSVVDEIRNIRWAFDGTDNRRGEVLELAGRVQDVIDAAHNADQEAVLAGKLEEAKIKYKDLRALVKLTLNTEEDAAKEKIANNMDLDHSKGRLAAVRTIRLALKPPPDEEP